MRTVRLAILPCLLACLSFSVQAYAAGYDPRPFPRENEPFVENEATHAPRLLKSVDPVYPADQISGGAEDLVWVAFIVDQNGDVQKARAFLSRKDVFEDAAVAAVKQWKFGPGRHLGHVVKTQMVVSLAFAPPKP